MTFWNEHTLDPKRSFRWTINFPKLYILDVSAKSVTKPSYEVSNAEHWFINHHFNFPGRLKWNPISVKIVDIDDTVLKIASLSQDSLLKSMNYAFPATTDEAKLSITKKSAVEAVGEIKLIQFNGEGKPVESWTLINPWISKTEFGELSYEDENLVEMTMEIIYDYAVVAPK